MEVQKLLRQQSKDFYAVGFDTLVKQWDKCINVGGGYVEKLICFSTFEYHMFYVLYPFVTYILALPHIPTISPYSARISATYIMFSCMHYTASSRYVH
jgi:hypothetical protein